MPSSHFKKIALFIVIILNILLIQSANACVISYARFVNINTAAQFQQKWPQSPLYHALKDASQCEITLKVYPTEKQLVNVAVNRQVDLAYLKDFSYYLVQKKDPTIKPMVVGLSYRYEDKKLSPYYTGYVLSLASNHNINSFNDLSGKTMGFLSPYSTSGFILPVVFLADQKINYQTYFGKTEFYNAVDDNLYQALLTGKIDAIATWDDVILRNNVGPIKVLKTFPNIPNPALVVINPLDDKKFKALQKALIALPYVDNVRSSTQGYALPKPGMYAGVFKQFDRYCSMVADDTC